MADTDSLRYPIGRFDPKENISFDEVKEFIRQIGELPSQLEAEVTSMNDESLQLPYRPGGWSARQVIHHIADSHMNGYIRCKLALTEDIPVIKPYMEDRWAILPDMTQTPVRVSLDLLGALHVRWVILLRSLTETDLDRKYFHPESRREFSLRTSISNYAWHGRHHLAHIRLVSGSVSSDQAR
jgi:hypothetical protein